MSTKSTIPAEFEGMGARIRKMREKKGIGVLALARRVRISQPGMSYIELGYKIPSCAVLVRIANELDCSTDYLLGREGGKHGSDDGA